MAYKADRFKTSKKNPKDKLVEHAELDFGIYLAEVIVRPKDATHSGRLTVFIPSLAKDRDDPSGYYNAYWSSPFAGSTPSNKVGENIYDYAQTQKTYGMWMVPPDAGNYVLVVFADGKKKFPVVIGCMFPDQLQYMVPGNAVGNTYGVDKKLPVAEKNRREVDLDHGNQARRPINPHVTKTILDQGLINDKIRGLSFASARRESPSRVFGILTPGPEVPNKDTGKLDGTNRLPGHSIVLDDGDSVGDNKNIRLRTGGGHQILMDDSTGILYVINKSGTAWIELSNDGDINLYAEKDFNMRARGNVNIRSDKNLNLEANTSINVNVGDYETADSNSDEDGNVRGNLNINVGNTTSWLNKNDFKLQTDSNGLLSLVAGTDLFTTASNHVNISGNNKTKIFGASGVDVKSGSDINVQASGLSNILGSQVHLNDGGSAEQAVIGLNADPLPITEYEDQADTKPDWDYDENDVDENTNPIPSEGKRPGLRDKIKSILSKLTTREPWEGREN